MTPPENIMDKVRAILRKADADQNSSEAEREVAMRMANKLLLKHGLDMSDVGDIDPVDQAGREFTEEQEFMVEGDEDSWRGLLLHRIARVYFVQAYRMSYGRNRERWFLVGRRDYIEATRAMFEFIAPQVQREFDLAVSTMSQQHRFARRYALDSAHRQVSYADDLSDDELAKIGRERYEEILLTQGREAALSNIMEIIGTESTHYAKKVRSKIAKGEIAPMDSDNLGVWRRSWFDGAVNKISNRLHDLMREEVAEAGESGVALVKDEKADLKKALEDMGLHLRSGRSNRQRDPNAANAGVEAGARVDVSGSRKIVNNPKELNA